MRRLLNNRQKKVNAYTKKLPAGKIFQPGDNLEQLFLRMEASIKFDDCISVKNPAREKGVEDCISAFIKKYKDLVKMVVSSYEGECITHIFFKKKERKKPKHYLDIQSEYDENYYMNDCGGYEEFRKTKGMQLDGRLLAFMNLVEPNHQDVILDIGCGRGELAYALSKQVKKVVGIDYSKAAIHIAEENFGRSKAVRYGKLKYVAGDVLALNSKDKYTKIVMADVYEHIEAEMMEKLLKKINRLLTEDGVLFIHTAPNLDYYEKVYVKQVKEAYKRGGFLPANPRSRYEDRMHINEQSPFLLKSTLQKYFNDVYVWSGNITREDELTDLNKQSIAIDITAIAGKKLEQKKAFQMASYGRLDASNIGIRLAAADKHIKTHKKTQISIPVKITNQGKETLKTQMPYPVYLSYHILNGLGEYIQYDGIRTPFHKAVLPKTSVTEHMLVNLDDLPEGNYLLEIDLVQEGCFWFKDVINNSLKLELEI